MVKINTPSYGVVQFDITDTLPIQAMSHVLANRAFGCLMTEYGFGHVWRRNSRENQITPWRNDPLANRSEEEIMLAFDGERISPFACANDDWVCRVEYGAGYAKYTKRRHDATITTAVFVPNTTMARVVIIETTGISPSALEYSATLRMGDAPAHERHIVTELHDGVIHAENHYNDKFAPQKIIIACSESFVVCNEQNPLKATAIVPKNSNDGVPHNKIVLVLGGAQNESGVQHVLRLLNLNAAQHELEQAKQRLTAMTQPMIVKSGDELLDNYLNGWALYQTLVCRMYARTSMYQCGGAYGFRDQLQDVCALIDSSPEIAKNQILRAASHQFEEGDVQHWWHESNRERGEGHAGVRMRCSDDLLFLPYVVTEYIKKTGDISILRLNAPYLSSPILSTDEHERYEKPRQSQLRETILEHCKRAIECVLERGKGRHGLLKILGGDWNDGMNRVGEQGKGESVWLTWFAAHVLERFMLLDTSDAASVSAIPSIDYKQEAQLLWQAARAAWDGDWYLRGYYDDGSTLGSHKDQACQIDSIAQSFAALDPNRDTTRVRHALYAARDKLVNEQYNYIKLFTPPFDRDDAEPGYIKGYLPGVRENGGQYTHAAVWLVMGFSLIGERDEALRLLKLMLPANRDQTIYRTEPYVLAADVYDNPEHRGRGGWSWYTGASGWYYRIALDLIK